MAEQPYVRFDKPGVDLTPANKFTDTIGVLANTAWWVEGSMHDFYIFDVNGSRVTNNWVIDLGDVDADSIVNVSLYSFKNAGMIQILDNGLAFFETVKVQDKDGTEHLEIQLQEYKGLYIDTTDTEIPIVLQTSELLGEVSSHLAIQFEDGTTYNVTVTANVINVDDRLRVMMSNFNRDYLEIYNDAMLQADNRHDIISAMFQNQKMREFIIRRDDFDSKFGTYSGLLNILDWFGYTNAVTIYEILKNAQGSKNYIDLGESIEQWANTWFRTNLLALVYNYNYVTEKWCAKCTAMPIIELNDNLPNQDTIKKLYALINVLEYEFLPEHIHFEDLELDIYSVYIATLLWATQQSSTYTVKPQVPGIALSVKDILALVDENNDSDELTSTGTTIAWVRPLTFYLNAKSDMTSTFGEPNDIFVALETPVDANTINAGDYIDWWLSQFQGELPPYLNIDRKSIFANMNSFDVDIAVMSNQDWKWQTEFEELRKIFDLRNRSTNKTANTVPYINHVFKLIKPSIDKDSLM